MITVSRTNPPPWIVQAGGATNEQTWPFATQADAEAAYRLAVASGQFTHPLRTGSAVTLVTLWRREDTPTIHGEPHMHYVMVDVPETAETEREEHDDATVHTRR